MNKKGITLIEIIVASAIFMILMSLVVGSFVSFINAKALSLRMKNSQEKIRLSLDMVTRLSRQADQVDVIETATEKRLVLLSNPAEDSTAGQVGAQFIIDSSGDLYYLECSSSCSGFSTALISTGQLLLKDMKLTFANSYMHRSFQGVTPYLDVRLESTSGTVGKIYYSDALAVQTRVLLKESY